MTSCVYFRYESQRIKREAEFFVAKQYNVGYSFCDSSGQSHETRDGHKMEMDINWKQINDKIW